MWLGDVRIIEGLTLVAAGSTAAAAALLCWYLKQFLNFLFSNIDLHGL